MIENLSQSNEAAIPNDPQDRNTDTDGSERCSTAKSFENEDFDSKIREGMERIKKLDAILCNKVKVISSLKLYLDRKLPDSKCAWCVHKSNCCDLQAGRNGFVARINAPAYEL